jgi:hypothetical protein
LLGSAGGFILVQHTANVAATAWGTDFATAVGRMGLITALGGRGALLFVADILLASAAVSLQHRRATRWLGGLNLVAAVALLLTLPRFLIDAGHMASAVSGPEMGAYRIIVGRTLFMFAGAGAVLLLAGRALLRLGRRAPLPR